MNKKLTLNNVLVALILFFLGLKVTFSYLNISLDWWLRHLTPNHEKFNPLHLPKNTTEILEFVIIPTLIFYLFYNFKKLGNLKFTFVLTFVLLLLNCFTAFFADVGILGSIRFTLKISAPIYLFSVLVVHHKTTGFQFNSLIKYGSFYFLFLTLVAFLIFDESFNRGAPRWPVYFSDLHTHNYVLAVTFVALSYYLRKNIWWLLGYFFITLAILTLGWGVRTAMLFYFIYITGVFYLKEDFIKNLYVKILAYLPFVVLLSLGFLKNFDINKFSSGRLSMYEKKLEILQTYTPLEWLFGRGWGSDLVITDEWWYAEKGSHNDYLTFLVENGLLFLLVFLLLIASLLLILRKNHFIYILLILGYLSTSLISNGFAVRTLAGYWFFTFLAFIYIKHKNKQLSFA